MQCLFVGKIDWDSLQYGGRRGRPFPCLQGTGGLCRVLPSAPQEATENPVCTTEKVRQPEQELRPRVPLIACVMAAPVVSPREVFSYFHATQRSVEQGWVSEQHCASHPQRSFLETRPSPLQRALALVILETGDFQAGSLPSPLLTHAALVNSPAPNAPCPAFVPASRRPSLEVSCLRA